jgi:hypothetical protein
MNLTHQQPEPTTRHEQPLAGSHRESAASPPPQKNAPGLAWSRVCLVSFWVLAFGLIATGVASSWERIVGRLASAPRLEAGR